MFKLTMLTCFLAGTLAAGQLPFEVVFEWNYMNYNWPSVDSLVQALTSGRYIPQNNALTGIKLWKDKVYLTIPRWKDGVPVTLAVTSAIPVDGVINPLLDPYPSWEMQVVDDCDALQSVQSMEIDPLGRLWAIDTGRTETVGSTLSCSPRLVILDLENNGEVLLSYVFPEEVAPAATTYLNDIVLVNDEDGTVFISDSGNVDPGIIVYSLKKNKSWKVRHGASMLPQEEAVGIVIGGTLMAGPVPIDGISLSPPGPDRVVYYTPLSSFYVYSVPVWVLKNSSLGEIDEYVTNLGRKSSQTDGMVVTNQGVLYLGLLGDDSIASWDTKNTDSFADGLTKVFKDSVHGQWPDTFAIDEDGQIWYTANALQNFFAGTIDIKRPNYWVLKASIHEKSYQYLRDGTAPKLPEITPACHEEGTFEYCVRAP